MTIDQPASSAEQQVESVNITEALAQLDDVTKQQLMLRLTEGLNGDISPELRVKIEERTASLEEVIAEASIARLDLVQNLLGSEEFADNESLQLLNRAILRQIEQKRMVEATQSVDENGASFREQFTEKANEVRKILGLTPLSAAIISIMVAVPVLGSGAGITAALAAIAARLPTWMMISGGISTVTRLVAKSRGKTFSDRLRNFFSNVDSRAKEERNAPDFPPEVIPATAMA